MMLFRVTWEIEVEALDETQAALIALAIQRDPGSHSLSFTVAPHVEAEIIDLEDYDDDVGRGIALED